MHFRRLSLLLVSASACAVSYGDTPAQLSVDSEPARATIRPVPEGRKLVRLPSLEYRFDIRARCGGTHLVESISINIADTRTTLSGDELQDSDDLVVDVTVPARQVSPIPVDGFCSAENPSRHELLVRDAMTAQLSLRCADESGEAITYASQPLAIALTCDIPDQEDQGDSESLILR